MWQLHTDVRPIDNGILVKIIVSSTEDPTIVYETEQMVTTKAEALTLIETFAGPKITEIENL